MDMPPETSTRWALTQRFYLESSDAIIGADVIGRHAI